MTVASPAVPSASVTALLAGLDHSTTADALAAVSTDRSGLVATSHPVAVVRARSVDDVRTLLARAHEARVPVVTRGAGSGLAGAATTTRGSIVLDLSGLDRILEIRADDQVAVVEPGVVTADLDAAAAKHGLFFAPDPGSVSISTVGGNIATNAGGLRGAKYGVTRDAVLALDVVLADGRLLRLGHETFKGVGGYDLTGLFVGSEGTLGVVVRATVRLRPRPTLTATAAAYFASFADAARAATAIGAAGLTPTVLEIVDGATLAAIDAAEGTDLRARGEAFLLAQTDGLAAELEVAAIAQAVSPWATSVEHTTDPEVADRLVLARRQALPSLERLGRVLIEDIAVPRSRLAEAAERVAAVARQHDVPIYVFAHAGDGNLHPIVLVTDEAEAAGRVQRAVDAVFGLALELGGTISGEHGVGLLKREWLATELGADVLDLQRQIKSLLDPAGILNPGKGL